MAVTCSRSGVYQRLIANQTFRFIYEELQEVNKTILDYFSDKDLVIDNAIYSPIDPKTGKTRTTRQKLAWIYQALESKAMQQFCTLVVQQEALLTTHDCVYFKQKLSSSVVLDASVQLQDTFPFLRFEHEAIYPIAEDSYFAQLSSEAEQFELEHKQRMAEEEIAAQGYLLAKARSLSSATAAHSAFFPAP
ncbi:MAG: hypothetical protein D4R84_13515 [Rhodocyclaceae bacterium]|nr:MAG: hypothetical protein D4R84_13515 [Rhodocyclaceae bacterium]